MKRKELLCALGALFIGAKVIKYLDSNEMKY